MCEDHRNGAVIRITTVRATLILENMLRVFLLIMDASFLCGYIICDLVLKQDNPPPEENRRVHCRLG
jgi:hypothetical protein